RETPFTDARGAVIKRPALSEHEAFPDLPPEEPAPADGLTPMQREAAEILARLNAKLGRAGPASERHYKHELKRENWGPENPASWRSIYRKLRPKLRIDSNGYVTGIR